MRPGLVKPLIIAGWVLFALEALFVLSLAISRNVGDDAAGRGMATGFAMLLTPILLLAGGLFFWGQRGGPALSLWVGLLMLGSPVLFGAVNVGGSLITSFDRAMGRAQFGKFNDAALTRLARAIDRRDTSQMRALLAGGTPDWSRRDRMDHTILGHAAYRVVEAWGDTAQVEPFRVLLAAGAPPALDALAPERTMRSVSEHDLVYHLYGVGHAGAVLALDTLLGAGASPNAVDEDGRPIIFSSYSRTPGLEVLARHGADLTVLDTREDQKGWTALMQATAQRSWDLALFFLQHGVPPDHTAPDGQSLRTILAEVDPPGSSYAGDDETNHAAFLKALSER